MFAHVICRKTLDRQPWAYHLSGLETESLFTSDAAAISECITFKVGFIWCNCHMMSPSFHPPIVPRWDRFRDRKRRQEKLALLEGLGWSVGVLYTGQRDVRGPPNRDRVLICHVCEWPSRVEKRDPSCAKCCETLRNRGLKHIQTR